MIIDLGSSNIKAENNVNFILKITRGMEKLKITNTMSCMTNHSKSHHTKNHKYEKTNFIKLFIHTKKFLEYIVLLYSTDAGFFYRKDSGHFYWSSNISCTRKLKTQKWQIQFHQTLYIVRILAYVTNRLWRTKLLANYVNYA